MKSLRYFAVLTLLLGTLVLLLRRGYSEVIVASEPLSQVSNVIAGLTGIDQPINQETLDVLGSGHFLARSYGTGTTPVQVGLFIAYFPTQRTGSTAHSPKNCLPGAGWSFESSNYVDLRDGTGKLHRVGEYTIAESDKRQFVIYWYQSHGRTIGSEYGAKFYLVADAIRMNRTDGALVRITTPILPSEGAASAQTRAEQFAAELLPSLPRFIPD